MTEEKKAPEIWAKVKGFCSHFIQSISTKVLLLMLLLILPFNFLAIWLSERTMSCLLYTSGESYYFTGMENMSVCLFIGQKNGPFFTRDTNGKIWMETYQESGEYPEGKRTKVEVTGIEEDCEEGNELLQITDNEEGIHILPCLLYTSAGPAG